MLDLEPSPLREDREPVLGGVASPAGGGAGAFFFLESDWTRASQGGSLGLWVPLDRLDSEIDKQGRRVHRGEGDKIQQNGGTEGQANTVHAANRERLW